MMKGITHKVLFAFLSITTMVFGCKRDEMEPGSARISVRLHDMPVDFDSVKVEITGVRIHSDENGWQDLNAQAGVYDLLELQNGVDTLLVPFQEIPVGHISQVRFILGSNNHVYIGGAEFPLLMSSQDESGLKINVHQELEADVNYTLVADFDAGQSILQQGEGSYRLKPVISAQFVN